MNTNSSLINDIPNDTQDDIQGDNLSGITDDDVDVNDVYIFNDNNFNNYDNGDTYYDNDNGYDYGIDQDDDYGDDDNGYN